MKDWICSYGSNYTTDKQLIGRRKRCASPALPGADLCLAHFEAGRIAFCAVRCCAFAPESGRLLCGAHQIAFLGWLRCQSSEVKILGRYVGVQRWISELRPAQAARVDSLPGSMSLGLVAYVALLVGSLLCLFLAAFAVAGHNATGAIVAGVSLCVFVSLVAMWQLRLLPGMGGAKSDLLGGEVGGAAAADKLDSALIVRALREKK